MKKPTVEEIREYMREIDCPLGEAEKFFDHFESNGWKVGGKAAMKNWNAAVRNWARRSNESRSNVFTSRQNFAARNKGLSF